MVEGGAARQHTAAFRGKVSSRYSNLIPLSLLPIGSVLKNLGLFNVPVGLFWYVFVKKVGFYYNLDSGTGDLDLFLMFSCYVS